MNSIEKKAKSLLPLTEATYSIMISLVEARHGYAIMQNISRLIPDMKIGPGTLYGALSNLLKQGLILRVQDSATEGGRRKSYQLTALGLVVVRLECQRLGHLTRLGKQALAGKEGSHAG